MNFEDVFKKRVLFKDVIPKKFEKYLKDFEEA